ncbi:hypothetical protein NDU88_003960 [Pleurodeles waltl]|uniref:Uncharacterized protein n=1 Tax=Pleurodeles waltl TaxID=8319 RepID=A0AAV7RJY9_PLEWA|nr:hypothetical protein NDU88_003960 [Pleurodeles waltl]
MARLTFSGCSSRGSQQLVPLGSTRPNVAPTSRTHEPPGDLGSSATPSSGVFECPVRRQSSSETLLLGGHLGHAPWCKI